MASVRMSPIAFAARVQQETGLEAVLHFASRDRNLMALQSDLMGAHMLGLRSAIALSGDPPSLGQYAGASAVWDVKAEGLIELIATLNAGRDSAGNEIGGRTAFTIAAAANPNNPDQEAEMARLRQKADAGCDVFFTQPTFDLAAVERFAERAAGLGRPIVLGVMVLRQRPQRALHGEERARHRRVAGDRRSARCGRRRGGGGGGGPGAGVRRTGTAASARAST